MALDTATTFRCEGKDYNVFIVDTSIDGEFLYKSGFRTSGGIFKGEGIGFYENQSITFWHNKGDEFIDLYQALSTKNSQNNWNKTVQVFSPLGDYEFEMYPNRLPTKLKRYVKDGVSYWSSMTIRFIATEPVR